MNGPQCPPHYDPSQPHDELTGLLKRAWMLPKLSDLIASGPGGGFGLILADIDRCAHLNYDHGYIAGDSAIRSLGEVLRDEAGENATICRYAGDKYLICVPLAAQHVAERIRAAARNAQVEDHEGLWLSAPTLTFAVAIFPEHGSDLDTLLAALDEAVHRGKSTGGDCVVLAEKA